MGKRKLPYRKGTWFAVPLRSNGYATGIVARMDGEGCVLGYFFGPKRHLPAGPNDVHELRADRAVLVAQFGDLGLLRGEWPVIVHSENWTDECWPLPAFIHIDVISGQPRMRTYADDLTMLADVPCDRSYVEMLPKDGLAGYGAVEIRLTKLLEGSKRDSSG